MTKLLTFPDPNALALSVRAKALVFNDPQSAALLGQVERIARSEATVLIVGETGTGKELIARHIHECSGRDGPFLAVNCGAFAESLVEAELFGHESGAFTGASGTRAGWFEAAHGGTLYLDEIGDLPLTSQVKLLRVLQERQVVRIGSRKPFPIDIRLIAATNVDLERAVAAGHFRMDLFYRLNVATVHLPPLHQRRGDILPLARHFLEIYRAKLKVSDTALSAEAQRALLDYAWPGNIRELENVIHYAMIVCEGRTIRVQHLRMSRLQPRSVTRDASIPAATVAEAPLDALKDGLIRLFAAKEPNAYDVVEKLLIETAFDYCDGNQVKTGRLLGISRNTVRTQLRRYRLLAGDEADTSLAGVE